MAEGARDLRSGHTFSHSIFFDEYVDIHHIFPQDWCLKQGLDPRVFDTVLNKTPLSYLTNRIIGGAAPSRYLAKLEAGAKDTPPLDRAMLDECLRSHAIDPDLLRRDDFENFIADRRRRLLALISRATGHRLVDAGPAFDDGVDIGESETNPAEAALIRAAE
jgi:hypothetical protein